MKKQMSYTAPSPQKSGAVALALAVGTVLSGGVGVPAVLAHPASAAPVSSTTSLYEMNQPCSTRTPKGVITITPREIGTAQTHYARQKDVYRYITVEFALLGGSFRIGTEQFDIRVGKHDTVHALSTKQSDELRGGYYDNLRSSLRGNLYFRESELTGGPVVLRYRAYGSTCQWNIPTEQASLTGSRGYY